MKYFDRNSDVPYKKQFRALCMKLHPDRGGDPMEFKEMMQEYALLSNEQVILTVEDIMSRTTAIATELKEALLDLYPKCNVSILVKLNEFDVRVDLTSTGKQFFSILDAIDAFARSNTDVKIKVNGKLNGTSVPLYVVDNRYYIGCRPKNTFSGVLDVGFVAGTSALYGYTDKHLFAYEFKYNRSIVVKVDSTDDIQMWLKLVRS